MSKIDKITDAVAIAGLFAPAWMPSLAEISMFASIIVSLMSAFLIGIQIYKFFKGVK